MRPGWSGCVHAYSGRSNAGRESGFAGPSSIADEWGYHEEINGQARLASIM